MPINPTKSLADYLAAGAVSVDLKARDKPEALSELCALLDASKVPMNGASILEAVRGRESAGTTGIGDGVAVPHARCPAVGETFLAVGLSRAGVPFDAPDQVPVRIFFLLVGPPDSSSLHLRLLAQIAQTVKDSAMRTRLLAAETSDQVVQLLRGP